MAKTEFPWDLLKAECLRLVCNQLIQGSTEGGGYPGGGRKEDMVDFLRNVNERGLEPTIKELEQSQATRKAATASRPPSPTKRKSSRIDVANEGDDGPNYNTRYKGSKRVKLTQEDTETGISPKPRTPRKASRPRKSIQADSEVENQPVKKRGRPRKTTEPASAGVSKRGRGRPSVADEENEEVANASAPVKRGRGRPRKSAPENDEDADAEDADEEEEEEKEEQPKRGRGRPRKSAVGVSDAPASKSGKNVFAGVLLKKRKADHLQTDEPNGDDVGEAEQSGEMEGGQEDGDGDEEDAVLAAVNGHAQGEVSSVAESNKENDPNDMVYVGAHDADADADADVDAEGDAEVQVVA